MKDESKIPIHWRCCHNCKFANIKAAMIAMQKIECNNVKSFWYDMVIDSRSYCLYWKEAK